MKNIWVALAILSVSPLPAVGDEYYVVRDVISKHCKVVESPPTTTSLVLVKDGSVYFDRNEAERALASVPDCTLPISQAASTAAPPLPRNEAQRNKTKGQTTASKLRSRTKVQTAAKRSPHQTVANAQRTAEQDPISSLFSLFR